MNKYIYIGDNKISGPLEKEKPMFSAWDMMANDATGQADRKIKEWKNHIASLPKIEVNGTHSWEINQVLEKDIDFVIAESSLKEGKIIEAIPIKLNTQYSEQNYSKGEKDLLASNSANGIDCCDAPVSCTNTDEQKRKVILIGGGDGFFSKELLQHLRDRDIELIDDIQNIDKSLSYVNHRLPQIPVQDLSIYGDVEKKKKPCTYHEYIAFKQKVDGNYIISKWACRHCGRILE